MKMSKTILPIINNCVKGRELFLTIKERKENGEPMDPVLPTFCTDPKKGVMPETNIRTDKWDAMQRAAGKKVEWTKTKLEKQAAEDLKKANEAKNVE